MVNVRLPQAQRAPHDLQENPEPEMTNELQKRSAMLGKEN